MNDDYCYADALSFQKRTLLPRTQAERPLCFLREDDRLPPGCEISPDGTLTFSLLFHRASSVQIRFFSTPPQELSLVRDGELWRGNIFAGTGLIGLQVIVDGQEVLSPMLPIGFGGNLPMNMLEVPEEGAVIGPTAVPHGSAVNDYFESAVSGKLERICVYLPPDYPTSNRKYPVLYLQHGHGENETVWVNQGRMNFIADQLIAAGRAVSTIVVMCNGMMCVEEEDGVRLGYTGEFPRMLLEEVIPFIESRYRVYSDAGQRAMAGLSMGSIQTSIVTLNHPELFSHVGLFSGFVQDPLTGYAEHLEPEKLERYRNSFKLYFRAIGDQDPYLPNFLSDDELLSRYGIDCERRIYPGGHEWKVWQHCFHDFYQLLFQE